MVVAGGVSEVGVVVWHCGRLVLQIPTRGCFILPFDVAGDCVRYFWIISVFMRGMPSSCLLLIACSSVGMEALKRTGAYISVDFVYVGLCTH
jgi:hypothetical protein